MADRYPFLSRSGWQKRIEDGRLVVNGKKIRPSYRLRFLDRVSIHHAHQEEPDADTDVKFLWEEAGIMAVMKPGRLPMHGNGAQRRHHLTAVVHDLFGKEWFAVHRLDKETSGIVLCAATERLRRELSIAWSAGQVHKEYQALVRGVPTEDTFVVDQPIGACGGSEIRIKKWVTPDGQTALTEFSVEDRGPRHSLLRARPRTGRTNQIRIHAAWSGYPLVGDKLYHEDEQVFLDYYQWGNSPSVIERAGFARCALHARYLRFCHPDDGRWRDVSCDLPPDLAAHWQTLSHLD